MINYEITPAHKIIDHLRDNQETHYSNIKDKSLYPDYNVDWKYYEDLSKHDLCLAVVMRDGDKIIGYSCYILTIDLNNNSATLAQNVALFIQREYRGKLIVDFIKECDKLLRIRNIQRVLYTYSDIRIGKLLEKAGYTPKSITWQK